MKNQQSNNNLQCRIIRASKNQMAHTNQNLLILELSEIDYMYIDGVAVSYSFTETDSKEYIFDFESYYTLASNAFQNEEIFEVNLSEFTPLFRDGKLKYFHKSVRL